jgi:3D (Asp-Asp-Asp) domain-containing protein
MKVLFLRGVIPACSLLLALNFSTQARTGQSQLQSQSAQSAETVSSTAPTVQNPFPATAPPDPRLKPIHPDRPDFLVEAHLAKFLETLQFDLPDQDSPKAPKTFNATAYTLKGRTATGIEPRPGVVAADPRVIPLGSLVQIKAGDYSGVYTVHDTGSAVKGNLVDVWMPSQKEALKFGRRAIKLQVLRYGPGTSQKKTK